MVDSSVTTTTTTTTTTYAVPPNQVGYLPQPNDGGVLFQGPLNRGDRRVPSAQGLTLNSLLQLINLCKVWRQNGQGWVEEPKIEVAAPRRVRIASGKVTLPSYFGAYRIDKPWEVDIPVISGEGLIKRTDTLYMVSMVCRVTAAHDQRLNVTFAAKKENTADIVVDTKENERRFRSFAGVVLSSSELTAEALFAALPKVKDEYEQTQTAMIVANKTSAGFPVGNNHFWALDSNWVTTEPYIVEPQLIDLVPICGIKRVQNITNNGITTGLNGEEPFTDAVLVPKYQRFSSTLSPEAVAIERLMQIFSGTPGVGGGWERAILNLTSGPVGNNPGFPGMATASPNNSAAIANGQRLGFSNQRFRQDCLGGLVVAGNDGSGNAELIFSLSSNMPEGTVFSSNATRHKIYAMDGTEIGALGTFRNLGKAGALIWTAGPNAKVFVQPTQRAWMVPNIVLPAGSGSNIPFTKVDRVWLGATEISPANIRTAYINDLAGYEAPANGENYIVVTGPERSAVCHYILEKVQVLSSEKGVVAVPQGKSGIFAYIEGVTNPDGTTRLDKPVVSQLNNRVTYNALIYKPPLPNEAWQFQVRYPAYEGLGNTKSGELDGATVVSLPVGFATTQGSGTSVFNSEGSIQYSPVAGYLPIGSSDISYYQLDAPIQWIGEGFMGDTTFRSMMIVPGSGLSLPYPGMKLSWQATQAVPPRSLQGVLSASGKTIGFRAPLLQSGLPYQVIVAVIVEKAKKRYLLILTKNTTGNETVAADSATGTGMDLFLI
jgi:hypothetical protein